MVFRIQKLASFHTDISTNHDMTTTQGQAHNPDAHTKPLLEQTVVEETEQETSEDFEQPEGHQTPVETDNESLSFLLGDGANSLAEASAATDSSLEDDKCDSPRKHQLRKGRDRSNTWSHTHTASTFKTAVRSGSLPPMADCALTPLPKLPVGDRGDSPFPSTPTCVSPCKSHRLLVCSEHRMSTSPRLPPIGCLNNDIFSPRSLFRNSPRELTREVTAIDPALVDNADPTDIRMIGRRRNALLTSPPYAPDVDRDS